MKHLPAILVLTLVGVGPLLAQHDESPDDLMEQHREEVHGEEPHDGEAHEHRNHIGLFVGVTDEEAETAFTLGVDYERRFSRWFGIGILVESILGDARELIVGVPVFLHATERLKFLAAAGYESLGPFEDEEGHHGDRETVVRLGVEYAFHVGKYSLSPALNVDFVEGEELLVAGVTIGRGF